MSDQAKVLDTYGGAAMNVTVVVTSISPPNTILSSISRNCKSNGWRFIIIGDKKSPPSFNLEYCEFFDLEAQRATGLATAVETPVGHYARKNIGYLLAMTGGAEIIAETDDDNCPRPEYFDDAFDQIFVGPAVKGAGWVNVYRYFSDANIWPRGLPLDAINAPLWPLDLSQIQESNCPIQQGLADLNPDVDAIYRLILPLPQNFKRRGSVVLGKGSWSPFNSQNTRWWPESFPLLYLPSFCSFRMTDIWRSFVAQRIAWENNWCILFHEATVEQQRNDHNLHKDFVDEIPGYLHNRRIVEALDGLVLKAGKSNIGSNMLQCYEAFVRIGVMDAREISLCETWLRDVASITNTVCTAEQ